MMENSDPLQQPGGLCVSHWYKAAVKSKQEGVQKFWVDLQAATRLLVVVLLGLLRTAADDDMSLDVAFFNGLLLKHVNSVVGAYAWVLPTVWIQQATSGTNHNTHSDDAHSEETEVPDRQAHAECCVEYDGKLQVHILEDYENEQGGERKTVADIDDNVCYSAGAFG